MKTLRNIFLLLQCLAPVACQIYTGFNYGAFWSDEGNAKHEADFAENFILAKSLDTPINFNSARLFTCKTQSTLNDPTEAFDAAVATNTSLLLGFWISPATRGDSPDEMVENEMIALGKGFEKHGQALSDLIIGLSVGSEDIYRWNQVPHESGLAADIISTIIDRVKQDITSSSFAQYMEGTPIGHVDAAQYAVVDGADFVGITAYPYWNNESIEHAKASFLGSLEDVKQRAGNTPVWIAEMGWPFEGPQRGDAVASAENYQKYWAEVGCSVLGMYTTFWFELSKDTQVEQPDWSLIDIPLKQPRIKDLSCPDVVDKPVLPTESLATRPLGNSIVHTRSAGRTTTTTLFTTVDISSPLATTSAGATSMPVDNLPWCVTVADIAWNGQYIPVAANLAGLDGKCTPAPIYNGLPYDGSKTMVFQSCSSSEESMPAMSTWEPSLGSSMASQSTLHSSRSRFKSSTSSVSRTTTIASPALGTATPSVLSPSSSPLLSLAVGSTSGMPPLASLRPTDETLSVFKWPNWRSAPVKRWRSWIA